jgi:hypothetical protein
LLLAAVFAGAPAYASEYTHSIEIPPGFSARWQAPTAFTSVVPGNPDVADILAISDKEIIITAKPDGGTTNIVLIGEKGDQVANLLVTNPTIQYQMAQSTIEGWQIYRNDDKCFPVCVRLKDKAKPSDRAPTRHIMAALPTP